MYGQSALVLKANFWMYAFPLIFIYNKIIIQP